MFFLFVSYLFSFRSLVSFCLSLSPVKPTLSRSHPFIFVLFYPAAFSVCLFITLFLSLPCFYPLLVFFFVFFSFSLESITLTPLSSSGTGSFARRCSLLFFLGCCSHPAKFPSFAFKVTFFFSLSALCESVIELWGILKGEKRADLNRERDK